MTDIHTDTRARSVQQWLDQDPKNVAAIHCKAGKGRTGTMIAAYLMHSGIIDNPESALVFFGKQRTADGHGVTIPSQRRYVNYYSRCLKEGFPRLDRKLVFRKISFQTIPLYPGGFTPIFTITDMSGVVFDSIKSAKRRKKSVETYTSGLFLDIDIPGNVVVRADVKVEVSLEAVVVRMSKTLDILDRSLTLRSILHCTDGQLHQVGQEEREYIPMLVQHEHATGQLDLGVGEAGP